MCNFHFFLIRLVSLFSCSLFFCANCSSAEGSKGRFIGADNFGLHIFYPSDGTKWPSVKFGALRLWDSKGTRWDQIQPTRDSWDFSRLDKIVKLASDNSVNLIYTFGQTPSWASSRPFEVSNYGLGRAAEPSDANDWDAYVTNIVRRYRGQIKFYEIWNEPKFSDLEKIGSSKFFSGSSTALALLTQRAYQIIKREDPNAIVLSPAFDGGVYGTKRLKAFLAAGGGSWVDGYSYHFYLNDQSPEWEIPRVYAAIQSVLRSYKQNDKPVFNTEIGFLTGGAQKSVVAKFASGPLSVVLDDADAAGLMARSVILSFSVGINSVYWFAWDSYSMGMTTDQRGGTPNAVGRAYGELYGWLNGAVLEGCHRYTGLIWLCSINRNGSGEIVIWSTEKVNFSLPRKSGVFREIVSLDGDVSPYRDGSSISIGPSPMLLR